MRGMWQSGHSEGKLGGTKSIAILMMRGKMLLLIMRGCECGIAVKGKLAPGWI